MKKAGVAILTVATASILTILTLACGTTAPATPPPSAAPPPAAAAPKETPPPVAETPAPAPPESFRGIDPADLDRSVPACVDLNQFRNGGWLASHPIPPDQSYWGSVSILFEQNRDRLRGILEKAAANPAAEGSDERKIGDFWASCMDEAAIEAAGAAPIQPELSRIDRIATPADLQAEIARLQALGANAVFQFTAEQDRRASTEVIAFAAQGGLGLPERDYYLKTDDASKALREKYLAHVARMFELLGDDPARAAANAKTVMAIETRLAEASMTRVEQRDSEKTYHRMDLTRLAALTPNFSWSAYFRQAGVTPAAVNVAQPRFFEAVSKEMRATPIARWKTYLRWTARQRGGAEPLEGLRRRRLRLLRQDARGHARERGALEALRRRDRRRARPGARQVVRPRLLPARGQGRRRHDGPEPDRRAARRPGDASLDGRGHAAEGARQARDFPAQDRLPRRLARLFLAHDRPRAVRPERPARPRIRVPPPPLQDRPAGRPRGLADDAARAQRLLRRPARTRSSSRRASCSRRSSIRRRTTPSTTARWASVIGHELTHGFDDEGRKFDAAGNLTRLVDARGRDELRGAGQVRRDPVRRVRVRGPARQRQARPRRIDRRPRRPRHRVPRLPGNARRPAPSPRRSTASRPTSASTSGGLASGAPTCGRSSRSS